MPLTPRDVSLLREIIDQLAAGLDTSDAATVAELGTISSQLGGTLTTRAPSATSVTGPIAALNNEVVLPVPQGATAVTCFSTGTWTGGLTAQASFDGGATWINTLFCRVDSVNSVSSTVTAANIPYTIGLFPGVTHIKAKCTSYTTGSLVTTLTAGVANVPPVAQTAVLGASSNRIGCFFASGIQYDESSTPLAAGATFTGTSRDATGIAANTSFGTTSMFAKEVRCGAVSDVAGTLHLEVSRDNVTFRRIESVATAAVGGSGLHVAKIKYEPFTRYYRFVFVNGGTGQGHFLQQTIAMAA